MWTTPSPPEDRVKSCSETEDLGAVHTSRLVVVTQSLTGTDHWLLKSGLQTFDHRTHVRGAAESESSSCSCVKLLTQPHVRPEESGNASVDITAVKNREQLGMHFSVRAQEETNGARPRTRQAGRFFSPCPNLTRARCSKLDVCYRVHSACFHN